MSDRTDRRALKRNREELEFLPAAQEILDTPPNPYARWTAFFLTMFFTIALAWSILGRIDTVATAEGQLVTKDRVKVIQPLENSIVRAIHVTDGQAVKSGELLVELDPTDAQANVDALRYDLVKARLEAASAQAILTDDPLGQFKAPDQVEDNLLEATRLQMVGAWEKHRATLASLDAEIEDQKAANASLGLTLDKIEITRNLFEILTIASRKIVQDIYLCSLPNQFFGKIGADKTSSSGNETFSC